MAGPRTAETVARPSTSMAALVARSAVRAVGWSYGLVGALAGGALVVTGFFLPGATQQWAQLAVLLGLAAVFARKLAERVPLSRAIHHLRRLFLRRRQLRIRLLDLELGLVAIVLVKGLAQHLSEHGLPLQALVLLLVAFMVSVTSRLIGMVFTGWAVVLETGAGLLASHRLDESIVWSGLLVLFALAHAVFLRVEVMRLKRRHHRELRAATRLAEEEARDFRLVVAGRAESFTADSKGAPRSREDEEQLLYRAAVEDIRASLYYTLELTKRALGLHTCVLLWLSSDGLTLTIKECATESERIRMGEIRAGEGAPGGVLKRLAAVRLVGLKRHYEGLSYYEPGGTRGVRHFCAVPVMEGPHLRAILCGDRRTDPPFSEREETALRAAAEQVIRVVQNERIFVDVEKGKYEQANFFAASRLMLTARTAEQAYARAFEACRRISEFDLGAITLFDREERRHRVVQVTGTPRDHLSLDGLEFGDNRGLAAMVVKNRHYLPVTGEHRDADQIVFTRKTRLRGFPSLLILPLIRPARPASGTTTPPDAVRGRSPDSEAIGSLLLACRMRGQFTKAKREMFQVIANQVAGVIDNAHMYDEMERRATVDGLTGLTNHRHFQERLDEMVARAERLGGTVSLILADVDHFKKVNDNYGHPVGDQVLKRVARVLEEQGRKTDIVARYGGEEFVMALEGTDCDGAVQVAERVREEVKRVIFPSDKGPFRITMSFGIAGYPGDASHKAPLIENADQALYAAKRGGRDRATLYSTLATANAESTSAQAS